ncbi:MAG: 2-oxo acid dehydrogenase subunit E2 [Nitrospinaceae bacterium]
MLNSRIDVENDRIIVNNRVNIGIAVDTKDGLVVPVIRDVDDPVMRQHPHDLDAVLVRLVFVQRVEVVPEPLQRIGGFTGCRAPVEQDSEPFPAQRIQDRGLAAVAHQTVGEILVQPRQPARLEVREKILVIIDEGMQGVDAAIKGDGVAQVEHEQNVVDDVHEGGQMVDPAGGGVQNHIVEAVHHLVQKFQEQKQKRRFVDPFAVRPLAENRHLPPDDAETIFLDKINEFLTQRA